MSSVADGLAPETITADGGEITLPAPLSNGEVIWYSFADGDAGDMELVQVTDDDAFIRIDAQSGPPQVEGPFKLRSPNIPKFIRLGAGSTIRVTVLRSETAG